MKKIGLLLATIIMAVLFTLSANAATEGYYTYNVYDGKATITDVDTSISGDVTIPSTLGGYSVTTIDEWAFYDCTGLTSIVIPDSVTSIGRYAFADCTCLTSMTLPFVGESLDGTSNTHFGYIFGAYNYEDVGSYIPTSLKEVIITAPCKTIGDYAFYAFNGYRGLTNIIIPDSVTSIGNCAFAFCERLTSITIPDSVTFIDRNAFFYCSSLANITIPDGVTSIGIQAFEMCTKLTNITIPDSVTSIGNHAFADCTSLTSITIPNSVTSIGVGAFQRCTGLTSVTLPFIGNTPDGTSDTYFGIIFGTYNYSDVNSYIPTSLKEVIITEPCKTIGDYAFRNCTSITNITISDSVTSIGDGAFCDCTGLTNIIIGDSVTSIGYSAFSACTGLASITIPDSVTSIKNWTFNGCTGLASIIIPDSVTSIVNYAFYGCTGITDVYYYGTEEQWDEISIGCDNDYLIDATIHFNCCKVNSDRKHSYTSEIITVPTHLTEGVEVFTCVCGYTYTEVVAKLTEHTYEEVVTEPTCTVQGYTTYTCECGYTYTDNFTQYLGHNMSEFAVVKDATCTEKGEERAYCSRCDYFETKAIKALGHNMGDFVVIKDSTCAEKGEKRADCLRCDYFKTKKIDLKQHIDANGDENCDACELYLPSLDCLCVCHAKSIGAFVYKLFTVLDELFGTRLLEKVFHITSEYCDCGLQH